MHIVWQGAATLYPIKRGTFRAGKPIVLEEVIDKPDKELGSYAILNTKGKILKVRKTKDRITVWGEFKKEKKKRMIPVQTLVKKILKSTDLRKEQLEKLFTRMLYFNLTEKDLLEIKKKGAVFQVPKQFCKGAMGEHIFLKVNGRYLEI